MFPNGIPNISRIVKGKQVYDPRSGSTAYSNNVALCIRDYISNTTYGLGDSSIDDTVADAAANVCNESATLAVRGTEVRYTCNGTFDTDQKPKDIIGSLLTSMQGKITYQGGSWSIYAGAYRSPTITLDEDDLDGPIKLQPGSVAAKHSTL